jgi:hypothetical protein
LDLDGGLQVGTANLVGGTVAGTGYFSTGATVNNSIGLNVVGANNIGTWTLADYSQSSTGSLTFDVAGVASADKLILNGNAILSGNLNINVTGPVPNHTMLDLIHADLITGKFTTVTLNALPDSAWKVLYTSTDIYVLSAPEPATWLLAGAALCALRILRRRRAA